MKSLTTRRPTKDGVLVRTETPLPLAEPIAIRQVNNGFRVQPAEVYAGNQRSDMEKDFVFRTVEELAEHLKGYFNRVLIEEYVEPEP